MNIGYSVIGLTVNLTYHDSFLSHLKIAVIVILFKQFLGNRFPVRSALLFYKNQNKQSSEHFVIRSCNLSQMLEDSHEDVLSSIFKH